MKKNLRISMLVIGFALLILSLSSPLTASAATFSQGHIIDDTVFDNAYTMSIAQINAFLNSFPNSCISTNNGFSAIAPTGYNPTNGYIYGGFVSAGEVIYSAAQAYGINPQVLLATLQKEEGLVTGTSGCSVYRYSSAMGYGCPDSGGTYDYSNVYLYAINGSPVTSISGTCVNSIYKVGFSQQVIHAAWLLKFGEQRSEGNINWAVVKGNWNNSDDPQSCYGGPMTQGTWQRCPSGGSAYYDGYTTIDGTSVHIDNGATAALYWYTPHFSGNQSFLTIFTQWFGNAVTPFAFKTPDSPNVYLYISGYKVLVPAMGLLQDYGISPDAIHTLSSADASTIPSPTLADNNMSPTLSYLIKSYSDTDADGGSLYLVSVGKKYQIQSMDQLAGFGFSESSIAYLPLSFIQSIPGSGSLSNYISTPQSSVFSVSSAKKQIIFSYDTYIKLNPANNATPVSYYTAGLVPSGNPIADREILVKYSTGDSVYLFMNGAYYSIASFDTYQCWGFDATLKTPVYRVPDNSYIAAINPSNSLSCVVGDGSGTNYLLSRSQKFNVSSLSSMSPNTDPAEYSLAAKLPTASNGLQTFVKGSVTPTIWYMQNSVLKTIPTYSNFLLLGGASSGITTIDQSSVSSLPISGMKLGTGQLVKTDTSGAVYIISNDTRVLYATSDDFLAYHNSWNSIETYPATQLDTYYPYQSIAVNKYLYDQSTNSYYLVDPNGCYKFDAAMLANFGQSSSNLTASQSYASSIFVNLQLSSCRASSQFVKLPGQALVYYVNNGQKQPITTYAKLQSLSGQANPYVITVNPPVLAPLPTGSSL